MPELSQKQYDRNIEEMKSFLDHWKKVGLIGDSQQVYSFPCHVRLRFKTGDGRPHDLQCDTHADIYVASQDYYKVVVHQTEWFIDAFVHPEYSPSWQKYRLTSKTKRLRITGEARFKNYKPYKLDITPTSG